MKKRLHQLLSNEHGVTSIEYALIGSLIAAVIVVAVAAVGDGVKADYEKVQTCLSAPSAKTCPN